MAELLLAECGDRALRRSERSIKAAQFPREGSLSMSDVDANIDPTVINHWATCGWVRNGLLLCRIGNSGIGKLSDRGR